jgi:hypothetical protein
MKPAGVETGGVADVAEAPIRRTRRQKVFAVLPTLLTLCNAACGFGAITITAKVGPEHFGGSELFTASQLIFLAMLFDMLDGSAARLTNQTSDFGAQLDSLCDAIIFIREFCGRLLCCSWCVQFCGWRVSTWRRTRRIRTNSSAACHRRLPVASWHRCPSG